MSCITDLINGWGLPCREGSGGVSEIYIASFNRKRVYSYDANGDTIIDIKNSTNTFKVLELPPESATFEEVHTASVSSAPTLVIMLPYVTAETRNLIKVLLKGWWTIIVKDTNGKYHIIGTEAPVYVSTGTSTLGKLMEDSNNRTITFTGKSKEVSYLVDPAIISDLVQDNDLAAPVITLTALSATASSFSWTSLSDATGYIVERSLNSDFDPATTVYTGVTASATVTGLTSSTTYYFRVAGTAPAVTSRTWGEISIKTP